jgi:hypothetical protein
MNQREIAGVFQQLREEPFPSAEKGDYGSSERQVQHILAADTVEVYQNSSSHLALAC